jgi:hypothetical protein
MFSSARRLLCSVTLLALNSSQCPDRVLAMKASHLDELVQNPFLIDARSGMIPFRYRFDQFASGCQTELPPDSVARHVESEQVTFS